MKLVWWTLYGLFLFVCAGAILWFMWWVVDMAVTP